VSTELPDERPQRRREYSGAGSTLGVAALIIIAVGVAIWFFELRGDTSEGAAGEAGFGIIDLPAGMNATGNNPAAQAGRAAPNFRLRTIDGGEASLTDLRGRYVLLNFWASWCGPCRGETPLLQAYTEDHPDGLVVVGVNQQESRGDAKAFVEEFGVTYPQLLDSSGQVSSAYRVSRGLPISFLIDPEGVILRVHIGQVAEEQLDELAAEAGG
jgi:cytochrome c biogenesis protein CcmG/thiol:disulfide interchange protein DsbE